LVVGWLIALGLGVALIWYGFRPRAEEQPETAPTLAGLPVTPLGPTLAPPLPMATDTLPPPATVEPTAAPPTPTEAAAYVVAGADGVNVRSGPGTTYNRLGYLDPGGQAEAIGRYEDWWQILYDNAPGWVYGQLVTAFNAENVPQVQVALQPTSPPPAAAPPTTAPPAAPTAAQPTAAPPPPGDFRGLVPDKFEVEGAPGPYPLGQRIWFNMWITNPTNGSVEYQSLGVWVQETGAFQKSYTYSAIGPNAQFYHRDNMQEKITSPGTYHLWLAIEFTDGTSVLLKGPVEIVVQ